MRFIWAAAPKVPEHHARALGRDHGRYATRALVDAHATTTQATPAWPESPEWLYITEGSRIVTGRCHRRSVTAPSTLLPGDVLVIDGHHGNRAEVKADDLPS